MGRATTRRLALVVGLAIVALGIGGCGAPSIDRWLVHLTDSGCEAETDGHPLLLCGHLEPDPPACLMTTAHVTVVLEGTTAVFTYHGDLSREFSPNADCGGRLAIRAPEPIDLTAATSFELVGSDADVELLVQNDWD